MIANKEGVIADKGGVIENKGGVIAHTTKRVGGFGKVSSKMLTVSTLLEPHSLCFGTNCLQLELVCIEPFFNGTSLVEGLKLRHIRSALAPPKFVEKKNSPEILPGECVV